MNLNVGYYFLSLEMSVAPGNPSERAVRYNAGADPGFFFGGGALVSCSSSTPINHIVIFFGRIPVVLEKCRSSQGGGAHPLHPPPRSAPAMTREFLQSAPAPNISTIYSRVIDMIWSNKEIALLANLLVFLFCFVFSIFYNIIKIDISWFPSCASEL